MKSRRAFLTGVAALAACARVEPWCRICGLPDHNTRWHEEFGQYILDWDDAVRPNYINVIGKLQLESR